MESSQAQSPEHIMELIQGAQATAIIKAGIDLGVFTQVAAGKVTAAAIAGACKTPERSTRLLCTALAAIGVLAKRGDTYANTPAAEQFLVRGKPTYLGDVSNLFAGEMIQRALGSLTEAVRNDGTVLPEHAETPCHGFWETFAQSSAAIAVPAAMALDAHLAGFFAERKTVRVLDVAAGSGLYGYTLCKRPNVELTLLDWPNVLVETRAWGARTGVDMTRVKTIEGSLFDVPFGGPYDVVLMSHVYHHFDEPTCAELTEKAAGALAPRGRLVIHDFFYDETLANPRGALFSMVMLGWTKKGQVYSQEQYEAWCKQAGLEVRGAAPSGGLPSTFLFADRR